MQSKPNDVLEALSDAQQREARLLGALFRGERCGVLGHYRDALFWHRLLAGEVAAGTRPKVDYALVQALDSMLPTFSEVIEQAIARDLKHYAGVIEPLAARELQDIAALGLAAWAPLAARLD